MSEVRIPLLERDQVPPELAVVYDALLAQRGVVPNMFKTVAHVPPLALAFAGLLKALLSDGALPGWYKELIATRMSVLCDSEYAIRAHAISARQKGASQEQIEAVEGVLKEIGADQVPQIRVYNKIDAAGLQSGIERDESGLIEGVRVSALTGDGCTELRAALAERFPTSAIVRAAQVAPV